MFLVAAVALEAQEVKEGRAVVEVQEVLVAKVELQALPSTCSPTTLATPRSK
jgi:hypothetical protein